MHLICSTFFKKYPKIKIDAFILKHILLNSYLLPSNQVKNIKTIIPILNHEIIYHLYIYTYIYIFLTFRTIFININIFILKMQVLYFKEFYYETNSLKALYLNVN